MGTSAWYNEHRQEIYQKQHLYYRTLTGKLQRMYTNAQQRVRGQDKKRPSYAGMPICSREEFYEWALSSSDYVDLYKAWVDSGFKLKWTPTIDRLDKAKGYTLDNIEIVSLSENVTRRDKCLM